MPETKEAFVFFPSGEKVKIAPPFPPSPFTSTEQTGIYTLTQKSETEESSNTFAVNAKTAGESDLRQQQTETTQTIQTKKLLK